MSSSKDSPTGALQKTDTTPEVEEEIASEGEAPSIESTMIEPMVENPVESNTSLVPTCDGKNQALLSESRLEPNEEDIDKNLVSDAFKKIKTVFMDKMNSAMEEIGDYLLEEFFAGDPNRVKNKKPAKEKSFLKLTEELRQNHAQAISKSWLYNAVNIAADIRYFKESEFPQYNELGLTHKVYLTRIKEPENKLKIAQDALNENLSTREIEKRINQTKNQRVRLNLENLDNSSSKQILMKMNPKKLEAKKNDLENKIIALREETNTKKEALDRDLRNKAQAYESSKEVIKSVLKEKKKKKRKTK